MDEVLQGPLRWAAVKELKNEATITQKLYIFNYMSICGNLASAATRFNIPNLLWSHIRCKAKVSHTLNMCQVMSFRIASVP